MLKQTFVKKIASANFFLLRFYVLRDFFKTRFSRCMLYRHNAANGTDWNLFFWDNSLKIKSDE